MPWAFSFAILLLALFAVSWAVSFATVLLTYLLAQAILGRMTTYGGMTAAQWAALASALLTAVLSVLSIADPGSVLAKPDMQTALAAAFGALVPILLGVFAVLTHQAAAVAATTTPKP